jgi:hypothetical protein
MDPRSNSSSTRRGLFSCRWKGTICNSCCCIYCCSWPATAKDTVYPATAAPKTASVIAPRAFPLACHRLQRTLPMVRNNPAAAAAAASVYSSSCSELLASAAMYIELPQLAYATTTQQTLPPGTYTYPSWHMLQQHNRPFPQARTHTPAGQNCMQDCLLGGATCCNSCNMLEHR